MRMDIIGNRYGKLVVLDEYMKITNGTKWKCKCDCGKEIFVYRGKLTTGHTKSCGCITRSLNGLSKHRIYSIWSNMKDRCFNSNCCSYVNYGEKGIKVSEEWLEFMNFYNWSMQNGYNDSLTIERIDSNKDYCKDNCEWITLSENVARANKTNNRRKNDYLYFGISPNGIKHLFDNAKIFSKENELNANGVRRVIRGERAKYKNWLFGVSDIKNI